MYLLLICSSGVPINPRNHSLLPLLHIILRAAKATMYFLVQLPPPKCKKAVILIGP